jgi:hypothetical protein
MLEPKVIMKFCRLVGLDTTKLSFTWMAASEDDLEKMPHTNSKRMQSTLLASTGIMSDKISTNININEEAKKWRQEFNGPEAEELERLVRAAMPDYEYLKERRMKAGEA